MELAIAVKLIQGGITKSTSPQHWVDLGAGTGLFTKALSKLLPAESLIYAIDKDSDSLKSVMSESPSVKVITLDTDFILHDLTLKNLDGILMANALHFVQDKNAFLSKMRSCLKMNGKFLVVEYDMDSANPWVPYPVSRESLQTLAVNQKLRASYLEQTPSRFNRSNIYSAVLQ
jgi:ubiquinone/menaquinone biosynthesis C-methylase UbiE